MKTSSRTTTRALIGSLIIVAASLQLNASQFAKSLYRQGLAAEAQQDYDAAFSDYRKAMLDDPSDLRYKTACERTRLFASELHLKRGKQLKENGNITGALTEFLRAAAIDPSNVSVEQAIAGLQGQITPNPAERVTSRNYLPSKRGWRYWRSLSNSSQSPMSQSLCTWRKTAKSFTKASGKAAGINVFFDPDYNSKRVSIDLTNTGLEDALRIVATASGTFWKPITRGTIFVAADTRAKRQELEQLAIQVFYLANSTQQNDLNDVQTALRNVLPNAKLYGVQNLNAIVMRGTPDELLLAGQLIDDLDKAKPEVTIDVAVMQVERDKVRNIGLQWPQTLSATLTTTSTTSGATLTLNDLANLNAKNFSLTVGTAQAEMLLTDTDTQILQNPRLRATDGQKATLKIGEKIPIATGSLLAPGVSATAAAGYAQTQFQYMDVGVNVEMTPTIHYNGDVSLKVKIEISSETGTSTIEGVTEPIIGQQSVEEMIRLKEGESNILGGLLQEQNNLTVSGTPGLGEIPFLKYLFSTQEREVQHEEIVFLITPHLVRGMQIEPLNLRPIDTGTNNSIQLREVQSAPAEAAAFTQMSLSGSERLALRL